jgi:hypothetical protein
MPGTNTLAYYEHLQTAAVKKFHYIVPWYCHHEITQYFAAAMRHSNMTQISNNIKVTYIELKDF